VRAFTLIELLVVVAIIAILAAIAVPNFLEAQARAKVSRARSDMRVLATVAESYAVDNGAYPFHGERLASGVVNIPASAAGLATSEFPTSLFTTPVAYLTALPQDPTLDPQPDGRRRDYGYLQSALMRDILLRRGLTASALGIEPAYGGYRLHAAGPDGDSGPDMKVNIPYDPTNGTVSNGNIFLLGSGIGFLGE
jgi:type II secretion system protein G